jgi:hypothetical protein
MIIPALVLLQVTVPVSYCVQDQKQEDHLRIMMAESLDEAFKEHFIHLFDIWVKQNGEAGPRARTGANKAIEAYLKAVRNLADWKPPRC